MTSHQVPAGLSLQERRSRSIRRSGWAVLALVVASCGGSSGVTEVASDDLDERGAGGAVEDRHAGVGDDSYTTTTTTVPPIGIPFVQGEVLAVDGISEIVGDGTIRIDLADKPRRIAIAIDGTVPVVAGQTCEFCMGTLELGPEAVAATTLFAGHDARGESVHMTVGLEGGMFPDDATQFIVAGVDGAVMEKVGAGYRLTEGAAWLVSDRSKIDADAPPPGGTTDDEDDLAPLASADGFVDEFDGAIGDGWTWRRPDPTRRSLTDSPGWLTITAHEQFPPTNTLLRSAPNSFEMTTGLRFRPTENFQFAGLIVVGNDDQDFSQLGRAFCDLDGCVGDGIYFDNFEGGTQLGGGLEGLAASTELVHLRLTAIGNEYTASFSIDGERWTVVGRFARDLTARQVGIVAHQAWTEVRAQFAYFTLVDLSDEAPLADRDVQYVATGYESGDFSPDVWLSTDLVTWERVATGLGAPLLNVEWNGQHWIATGQGIIATSPDARTWTIRQDMGELRQLMFHDAAWGGAQWTVVGDLQILGNPTSDWTGETFGAGEMGMFLFAVASNGQQWVAVGSGWQVLSYDLPTGTGFTRRHGASQDSDQGDGLAGVLWDVAWGNGLWIAVGEDGRMLASHDGVGWNDVESGTNEMLRTVAHNGTTWMVASSIGNVFTSSDGFEWRRTNGRPDSNEIVEILWDGCHWVASGDGVHTSVNGDEWTRHDAEVLIPHIAVAFDPGQTCS